MTRTGSKVQPEGAAIRRAAHRGGSVLIPAFAVDRTELVLLAIHRLMAQGQIPRLPVFVDSPMAIAALNVYRRALRALSPQLRPDLEEERYALDTVEVHGVADPSGSMRLNRPPMPSIVISASGMATGGRVVHHLASQLPDPRNVVVLTGYQAVGTRGRGLGPRAPRDRVRRARRAVLVRGAGRPDPGRARLVRGRPSSR